LIYGVRARERTLRLTEAVYETETFSENQIGAVENNMSDWIKECVDSLKASLDEIASADCAPARGSAATHEPDTTLVRITLKGRRWKIIRTALWPGNKAITVRLRKANMNFEAKPPNAPHEPRGAKT